MENVEFRVSPDGKVFFSINGEEKRLTRFHRNVCTPIAGMIKERFPGAWSRLVLLYHAKVNTPTEREKAEFLMIERFIRCNFGEHDLLTPDIEEDILNFEEVRCPLRGGFCPHENIICKPQSLIRLSKSEKEVVKFYLRGETFDEIARILKKSPSTVKVQLHNIKNKLGAKNCRDIIRVIRFNNI